MEADINLSETQILFAEGTTRQSHLSDNLDELVILKSNPGQGLKNGPTWGS